MTPQRQFSVRSLFVLTAIISAILAVALRLSTFFTVCLWTAAPALLVIAVFHSANFATSDRRPRLALVAWIGLGLFFVALAFAILLSCLSSDETISGFATLGFAIMAICGGTCFVRAGHCGRLIARSRNDADSIAVATLESSASAQTGQTS